MCSSDRDKLLIIFMQLSATLIWMGEEEDSEVKAAYQYVAE